MHPFLTYTRRTRTWSAWQRYGAATLTIAAVLLLGMWMAPLLTGFPFLLVFVVILVNAALFGRAVGAYSVLLSAAVAVDLIVMPLWTMPFSASPRPTEIVLFMITGLAATAAVASLRSSMHDLAEANERLAAAEREKDLLLREAGHRVKNDLASLMALVRLQERSLSDPAARAALASTGERIRVLSRLHERLRRADKAAVVDIGRFITELCDDLRTALHGLRPVALKVQAESCLLPQEQAVAVGLIANELLTNALKYAFPDDRGGTITVRFARQDDTFELVVADDGVGLAAEEAPGGSSGLGQRLIRSLAAQLGGTVEIGPNSEVGGTRAAARFPAKEA
jgi:two-component sensor histidine kinase